MKNKHAHTHIVARPVRSLAGKTCVGIFNPRVARFTFIITFFHGCVRLLVVRPPPPPPRPLPPLLLPCRLPGGLRHADCWSAHFQGVSWLASYWMDCVAAFAAVRVSGFSHACPNRWKRGGREIGDARQPPASPIYMHGRACELFARARVIEKRLDISACSAPRNAYCV